MNISYYLHITWTSSYSDKVFTKDQYFFINFHNFSIKSYVLVVY